MLQGVLLVVLAVYALGVYSIVERDISFAIRKLVTPMRHEFGTLGVGVAVFLLPFMVHLGLPYRARRAYQIARRTARVARHIERGGAGYGSALTRSWLQGTLAQLHAGRFDDVDIGNVTFRSLRVRGPGACCECDEEGVVALGVDRLCTDHALSWMTLYARAEARPEAKWAGWAWAGAEAENSA